MLRLSCTTFVTPQHEAIVQELFSVQNRTDSFTYVAPTQDESEHKSNKIRILTLGIFMLRGFSLNEQPVWIPVESETSNENEVEVIDTSGLKLELSYIILPKTFSTPQWTWKARKKLLSFQI